jgi:hypothetical protein
MSMGQQFCTVCGAKLPEGIKFCESCGAPVTPPSVSPITSTSPVQEPLPIAIPGTPPAGGIGKFPLKIIAGLVIVLIIAAVAVVIILPKLNNGSLPALPGQSTPVPTTVPTPVATPTTIATTVATTPPPDPFPNAYKIRELFNFNEGKYKSRATVYRYWINETYHWHNDMDNKFYTEPSRPKPGYKYLLIFVNIENIGSDGYPYPKSNMIVVHNGGNIYRVDTTHYLPNKAGDKKATPVEILELETQSDYFKIERVEDYGFSHATTQDFVNPGQGNAVDGYLIYIVPDSLIPENTYVEIVFDGQDRAVWKLG